jgi:hypothetical protein
VSHRYLRDPLGERTRWAIGITTMRDSDKAWVALAGGMAACDLIAADDEQVTNAGRPYFKSQPIDDPGDRPASGRRHTAVVRPDHADGSPRGNPPHSIAPYSSAMTVGRTRRSIRWLRPFTRCSRTSQTTRAVPHATYSRFGRCVRRQRQWTLGRCRRHWGRLVKSGR